MSLPITDQPVFAYRPPYGKHLFEDMAALATARDAGIDIVCLSPMNTCNSLGDPYSPYPQIWNWLDSYDFTVLEQQINDVLAVNPRARFITVVDLNSPLWLARHLSLDSFYEISNCSLSKEWKKASSDYLSAFLDYCEKHHAERMLAYVLACGRTLEWIEAYNRSANILKSAHYPQWCKQQQHELLPIPRADEIARPANGWIYDPASEKHVSQWLYYVNYLTADLAIHFIRSARGQIRPEARIGLFYGHIHHLHPSGQMDCERVLKSAAPDFFIGAACNSNPVMGSSSGYICTLKMCQRYGVAYMHECDRITSTGNLQVNEHIALSGGIWVKTANAAEDCAMIRRETALCLINRFSIWWFNIWGHAYDSAESKAALKNCREVWERYMPLSTGSAAQTLLVFAPENNYHIVASTPNLQHLAHKFRQELYTYGVPFDTAAWSDLADLDLSQYRLVLFQNPVCLDDQRLAFLRDKVLRDGRVVVWLCPPGSIFNGQYRPDMAEAISGNANNSDRCVISALPDAVSVSCYDSRTLDIEQFRELAALAKVHLYADKGNAVMASREFLMIHRQDPGQVNVVLPGSAKSISEVFSGRIVAQDSAAFSDAFDGPDTRLYHLAQE
jgi:hypothetical protein